MTISSPQALAPPDATQRIEADVVSAPSPVLQNHYLDLMAASSVAKTTKASSKDTSVASQIIHEFDKAEAGLLNSKTMPLTAKTDLAKNEIDGANLAVVFQNGKKFLDMNHEDPLSPAAKLTADHAAGLV